MEDSQEKLLKKLKECEGKDLEVIHEAIDFAERNQTIPQLKGPFNGMKSFLGAAARKALTIVGVISVLSLAGFEPRLKKQDNQFKIFGAVQLQGTNAKGTSDPLSTRESPRGRKW
ncbi:plastid division PDV2 [Olea europaea subsp. europaea]|uniref:Plastid division PDV2 n=1 Tax=Olea europaea subsp. europaea TaxID=158383 RepID=A0A8S0VE51_OLEEU|nr:plastid division PDV2 [Olea europaea subsp. europaea]